MVQKNITKQPKSLVEVTVSAPWADISSTWDQTLQRLAADVEIAGFRKGQAPINMVEGQLGSKLQEEVLKAAMPNLLIEALKGTDIVPIDYPKYELTNFVKAQGISFKATITNRPTVTIGTYKGIKVAKPELKEVSNEEVQKVIDDLFKRWKAKQSQPAVSTTPAPAAGGTGSLNFQGAPEATTSVADEPGDTFGRAMGALSLNDLKEKVKKDLEANVKYNNELDYEEAILQEVEKLTTVELPDILIQDELNRMLVSLQRRVADMGLLLEDYLKGQNKTLDQIKTEWKPQAEKNVKMELGLAEIARQENVNISDAELQAEVEKITDPKVKKQFEGQEPKLHLRHALRQTRTLDLLKKMVGGERV